MPKVSADESSLLLRVGSKEILSSLLQESPKRYKQLYELTENGRRIFQTTTTLANRLRELAILGLISKHVDCNVGERVMILYRITEDGKKVFHHLEEVERILSNSKV